MKEISVIKEKFASSQSLYDLKQAPSYCNTIYITDHIFRFGLEQNESDARGQKLNTRYILVVSVIQKETEKCLGDKNRYKLLNLASIFLE